MKKFLKSVFSKLASCLNQWHDTNTSLKEHQIDAEVKKQEIQREATQDQYIHEENMQRIESEALLAKAFTKYLNLFERCLSSGQHPPQLPVALLGNSDEES